MHVVNMEAMPASYNSPKFVEQLIEIFKKNTCLWKMHSPEYGNKVLKTEAYNELVELAKTIDENATVHTVKRKLSSLRRTFRKEFVKVETARKLNLQYIPKLWYYDLLSFTTENVEDGNNEDEEFNELLIKDAIECTIEENPLSDEQYEPYYKKRKVSPQSPHRCLFSYDEFDAFGMTVAAKLRRMDDNQRIYCENLINNVIYMASLNKLDEHVVINKTEPETNCIINIKTEDI